MSSSNTIQHCQNIISRSGGHSDIAWDLIKTPQATNLLFLTLTYHSGVLSDGKERRQNRTNALLSSIILYPLWLPLTFLILKIRVPTFSGKKTGLELHQKTTGIIQSQLIFLYIFSWYHFCLIFVEGYKI